jgi:putative membrane protein
VQDPNAAKLSSVKTYLLVALIFEVIAVLVFLVSTLTLLIVVIGIIFVIPLILSILVLMRIRRMRRAAEAGDIATLKQYNSVGWAILALIFAGIIPGIMLLVANGAINDLNATPVGTFAPAQSQWSPAQTIGDVKFCPVCGAKVAKSAAFCPSCGAPQK